MTLRRWFYRNAMIPIGLTVAGIIVIGTAYIIVWQVENQKRLYTNTNRLVELGSFAINQNNRPLLESVLQHSFYELHAQKIAFCRGDQVEISFPSRMFSCKKEASGLFTRVIDRPAIGMPDYHFYFYVPVISSWGLLSFVLLLSVVFVAGSIITFIRMNRRMNSDLLTPLVTQIQGDAPLEISELESIRQNNKKLSDFRTKEAISDAILKHNARVAHDIRDPIATIDKLLSLLPVVPAELKTHLNNSLERMNTIAQDLLNQVKFDELDRHMEKGGVEPASTQLVSELLLPIISEKRLQLGDRSPIQIKCKLAAGTFGLFIRAQPIHFRRAISNLINNAVQAIDDFGTVSIDVESDSKRCTIRIQDDGKGILDEIIPKLGQEGFSYDKEGGSGIGLYSAKRVVENMGGELEIHSQLRRGTNVSIILPRDAPPPWFMPQLEVVNGMTIAVLDDQAIVHDVWRDRFAESNVRVKFVNFLSGEELRQWVQTTRPAGSVLYLCDYELKGESDTGIDIICQLGIADKAVLVTGHSRSPKIRAQCEKKGIRLIPKELVSEVPIVVKDSEDQEEHPRQGKPQLVLVGSHK
jgi:signal transduction histidine kinase